MALLNLQEMIAPEFKGIRWTNCPVRYRVIYGARNTGKSYTFIGLEPLVKILTDKRRNVVMFRAVAQDIKDTCFSEVQKALFRTGLFIHFQVKTHDLEIVYKKTGQKILFVGCDRPTAVNSITVPVGEITDFYFEEAFDLKDYQAFRKMDGSLRGVFSTYIPKNGNYIPKQVTLVMNPWESAGCWIYDVFVKQLMPDTPNTQSFLEQNKYRFYKDVYYRLEGGYGIGIALHQSSVFVNHWRDKSNDIVIKNNREKVPAIYKTENLGMWGATGELVYSTFNDNLIISPELVKELQFREYCIGIDTAFSNGEGKVLTGSALEVARIHHAYSIHLCGITRNDYKGIEKGTIIALDEYYHTQEIGGVKKTQPQLIRETLDVILKWINKYQKNPTLFRTTCNVFVDSADASSLDALDYEREQRRIPKSRINFKPSTKKPINTRIRFSRYLMGYGKMRFSQDCPNLIREIRNCHEGKGKPREDINDHALNSWEYGTAPLYTMTKESETFKAYR